MKRKNAKILLWWKGYYLKNWKTVGMTGKVKHSLTEILTAERVVMCGVRDECLWNMSLSTITTES